jgi:hypothetical protein
MTPGRRSNPSHLDLLDRLSRGLRLETAMSAGTRFGETPRWRMIRRTAVQIEMKRMTPIETVGGMAEWKHGRLMILALAGRIGRVQLMIPPSTTSLVERRSLIDEKFRLLVTFESDPSWLGHPPASADPTTVRVPDHLDSVCHHDPRFRPLGRRPDRSLMRRSRPRLRQDEVCSLTLPYL